MSYMQGLDNKFESNATRHFRRLDSMYLQSWVLLLFVCAFGCIAVIIELLLFLSNKNSGIATSTESIHYLWTYGPTVVLTMLSAAWSRVIFQSSLLAPWWRLEQGPTEAERGILLDYLSMWSLFAIRKAFLYGDWFVALSSITGWAIQLAIILSTGLINLTPTLVTNNSFPVSLGTSFLASDQVAVQLSETQLELAHSLVVALFSDYIQYPNATSAEYAWQRIDGAIPDGIQLTSTIDAFSASLECEPAAIQLLSYDLVTGIKNSYALMSIDTESSQCYMNQTLETTFIDVDDYLPSCYWSVFFSASCNGSQALEDQRIIFALASLSLTWSNETGQNLYGSQPAGAHFVGSHAVVCTPGYQISKVDITQNSTQQSNISLAVDPAPRMLDSVHPWEIMQAHIDSYETLTMFTNVGDTITLNNQTLVGNLIAAYIFLSQGLTGDITETVIVGTNLMQDMLVRYYKTYAAQLAPLMLMNTASESIDGQAASLSDRLVVSALSCHLMAALLAVCSFCGIIMAVLRRSTPDASHTFIVGTLVGIASIMKHSPALVSIIKSFGHLNDKEAEQALRKFSYSALTTSTSNGMSKSIHPEPHLSAELGIGSIVATSDSKSSPKQTKMRHPWDLHYGTRLALCISLGGTIVALQITLHLSSTQNGLGDCPSNQYMTLLWSTFPAQFFSLLALILDSMAQTLCAMTLYINMERGVTLSASLGLDLLNGGVPRIIYRAGRAGNLGTVTMILATLLLPFFNIFTSSLFRTSALSRTFDETLLINGSFKNATSVSIFPSTGAFDTSSIQIPVVWEILMNDMSYPAFTHETLTFPELSLQNTTKITENRNNLTSASIQATVPALRTKLHCTTYTSSMIQTNLTLNYTLSDLPVNVTNPLTIDVAVNGCRQSTGYPWPQNTSVIFDTRASGGNFTPLEGIFMFALPTVGESLLYSTTMQTGRYYVNGQSCSTWLFLWGGYHISNDADPQLNATVSAMGCNLADVLETVDVEVEFQGADLQILSTNILESTARNSSLQPPTESNDEFPFEYLDGVFNSSSNSDDLHFFDSFASLLTQSRDAIPVEYLTDATRTGDVENAIIRQYGIVTAQQLSIRNRATATNANVVAMLGGIDSNQLNNDPATYNATVTIPDSYPFRVEQDVVSTYILEGLLAAVLLLTVMSWVLMPRANVLPRSPTSIANAVLLIGGGNLLDIFEEEQQQRESHSQRRGLVSDLGMDDYVYWLGWRETTRDNRNGLETDELSTQKQKTHEKRFGIWAIPKERDSEKITDNL